MRRDVIKRSTKVGLIVGSILTLINQGYDLLGGVVTPEMIWQIPLTYCVPYCVSTYAAVDAILQSN